jgi:SAM-dependent methyltransferase
MAPQALGQKQLRRRLIDWASRRAARVRREAYGEELDFWRDYLHKHAATACDRGSWESAFPSDLRRWAEQLAAERGVLDALEIGSGPVSLLAWGVERGLFRLTAVDPLADEYAALMEAHGCSYPVRPIRGYGEQLSKLFDARSFDLAYASNALDHTRDPRKCLEEITRVLRGGGLLFCEGFVREGTNAGWSGLHQHDLVPEDGHLVRYDRQGRRQTLTTGLGLECLHQDLRPFVERGLTSHGQEWTELEERDWRYDDWFTLVWRRSTAGRSGT